MMRHSKCRVGKNRLAGNRGLTDRNERHRALRQIHVKAAAEADNAEAFACREVVPFLHIAHDAARDETGNLHHHDILAIRALDHHGVALIRIARLVEIGIEEKAGAIGDALHLACNRRAVHMAVEHIHEDADAGARHVAKAQLLGRTCLGDEVDHAIGRADDETFPRRRHAIGVAEEIKAPEGQHHTDPAERVPDHEENDGDGRKDIWGSMGDVFASAANYLKSVGWRDDVTWGRQVRLPDDFDTSLANLKTKKSLAEWQALGVRRYDGADLPQRSDIEAAVVIPDDEQGRVYLAYANYDALMRWNRSHYFVAAVGYLSDRIRFPR